MPTPTPAPVSRAPTSLSFGKRPEDDDVRPYVLVGDLGKGSFATVYKGYHSVCIPAPFPMTQC